MEPVNFGAARFNVSSDYLSSHDIVYALPSVEWIDGLPLGNGDIGVMVYGTPSHMKFSFNKSDVWDYRYEPYWLTSDFRHNTIAKAIEERDWERYTAITKDCNELYIKSPSSSFQPCGQLEIRMNETYKSFYQRLSLRDALVQTNFILDVPGLFVTLETHRPCTSVSFIDAVRNIFVFEFNFKGKPPDKMSEGYDAVPLPAQGKPPSGVTIDLYRLPNENLPKPKFGNDDVCMWMDFTFPDGFRYTMLLSVDGAPYTIEKTEDKVTLNFQGRVAHYIIYLSIVTSKDSTNPLEAAKRIVLNAKSMGSSRLLEEHKKWWRDFWQKSFISLPDKLLENLWYKTLYDIASCSRDENTMPGLQGLWSIDNFPAWHGDYHLDPNVQMLYWPVYTANHPELAEPLYHTFWKMLSLVKENTKRHYGLNGVCIPMTTEPEGKPIGGWFPCSWWPMAGAWLCQHFWWGYTFTKDVKFLREVAYPFMKECVKFYEGYLKRDEKGRIVIFPSHSPEVGGPGPEAWGKNSTCDIALMKFLFKTMIEASELLGVDKDDRMRWKDIIDNLPEYPIVDGHLIDMEWRSVTQSRDPWTAIGSFYLPIYPLGEIGLGSSEEWLKIGKKSYEFVRVWHSLKACLAARLGLGEEAVRQLCEFANTVGPNGMNTNYTIREWSARLYQIDANCAFAAAINEMLLQSYNMVIRVFPATPQDWSDVKFAKLRAEGAFLVSSEMEDGVVKYVLIESLSGGVCRLINPWPGRDVMRGIGIRDLETKKTIAQRSTTDLIIEFMTEAGHTYTVEKPEQPLESHAKITLPPPDAPRLGIGRFHCRKGSSSHA